MLRGGCRPDGLESAEGTTCRRLSRPEEEHVPGRTLVDILAPSYHRKDPFSDPHSGLATLIWMIARRPRRRTSLLKHVPVMASTVDQSFVQPEGIPSTIDDALVLFIPQAVDIIECGIGRFFGGRVVSNECEDG